MIIQKKGNKKIVVTAIAGIIFFGIIAYVGGMIIFPNLIVSSYENKDCTKIREYHDFVSKTYPLILENYPEFVDYINECDLFMNASARENDRDWEGAHNLYQTYETKYVSGVFTDDVRSRHAAALISWTSELKTRNEYDQALATVNIVIEQYSDTSSAKDAFSLLPEILTDWGRDLRSAEKFDEAEIKFIELAVWAQINTSEEYEENAKEELGKTYLVWGHNLSSSQDFEAAKAKFEQVIEIDINAEAQDALQNLYIEWAEQLLIKNDYLEALKHIEAANKIETTETTEMKVNIDDLLVRAYVQWATDFAEKEDFLQALEKLDEVESKINLQESTEHLEVSRQDIYILFSNSDGQQAQAAMADAAEKICNRETIELPIFGTTPNNIKAYLFPPAESQLSDDIRAFTPSSMHYVACVTESVTSSIRNGNLAMVLRDGPNENFTIEEFKFFWNIILRRVSDGEMVNEQMFSGGNPPKNPRSLVGGYNARYGARPNVEVTISNWLKKYLK